MDKSGGHGKDKWLGGLLALALVHGAASAVPAPRTPPGPALRGDSGPRCSGEAARPANMILQVGKSNLMRLPEPVQHRAVGNPGVVQAMLVAPDTLYLVGVDIGSTNMIVQGKSGACSMIDIVVAMDPAGLQGALAAAMPDERNIKVLAAADALVLTGTVSDGAAVSRAFELATAFVRRPARALHYTGDAAAGVGASSGTGTQNNGGGGASAQNARVVNMLSVTAPQQVMLEVKIAEVSKTLLERLEAGSTWKFSSGSWAATLLSNFISGSARGLVDLKKANGNQLTAEAQKQDALVRILAEPTVMAISGQEGSFLAGGRFYIPVAQDNNKVTLEEKEFGVGLRFVPTVLANGRINLRVSPEVSELSREGIGLSATGTTGNAVLPLVTTRRASTTVQLNDGQSFAIGGLIKNNLTTNLKGLPMLGEVPVLGALFRSTDYQQDRTELVFVVTAHLVKPLPANFTLPTDKVTAPTRSELLLGGRLEGTPAAAAQQAAPAGAANPDGARSFELK